jgi:1,2-diacylglycerol 3-alpha-glucosyltransferase
MVNMGLAAISYARMKGIPAMASLETLIPDGVHYVLPISGLHGLGKAVGWAYLRWFYSKFELVTAPSRHAQGLMAQNGIEAELLPSPVDTRKFRPASQGMAVRRRLGLEGRGIILSVGRVVKEKNYSLLIGAAKRMRGADAVFLVVGKGPYLEGFKREVAASGLSSSFYFAGFVPDALLPAYYNAADCFVFPSSFETQGLSALEAMACGKPVCALENTPMSELIVEGRNGFAFSGEEECAVKLERCLQNSGRMAAQARATAEKYSIPKCTEKLLSCYRRLLE